MHPAPHPQESGGQVSPSCGHYLYRCGHIDCNFGRSGQRTRALLLITGFATALVEQSGPERGGISPDATLIYVLDILAVVAAVFAIIDFVRRKNVVFTWTIPTLRARYSKGFPTHPSLIPHHIHSGHFPNA